MSAAFWIILGIACVGAVAVGCLLMGINKVTEGDDYEQWRAVSRPAELDEQLRKDGLL
jgi:hypothetical protein